MRGGDPDSQIKSKKGLTWLHHTLLSLSSLPLLATFRLLLVTTFATTRGCRRTQSGLLAIQV